ncbi:MAG: GH92 family glycosyl hydrolase [Lewinellaceae bacterium]|nr:GH92 family glycosyl hydrolase [Lewinellaceae bacterium]
MLGAGILTASFPSQPPTIAATNPLAFVDPFIGTGGHGHTFPGATAPFGMVQLSPDTRPGTMDWDGCSGYHYSDSIIYGFSHTHLSGTGVPDYCDVLMMPYTGRSMLEKENYASAFRKSEEHAEAGYYSVLLDKYRIQAELTATERVGVHRYTYPMNVETEKVLIDLRHRDEVIRSTMTQANDREIVGLRVSKGWAEEQQVYFVAHFSKPISSAKIIDLTLNPRISQRTVNSKAIIGLLDFVHDGTPLVVTVGISSVSVENARKNLEAECNDFDFNKVKEQTQAKWLEQLTKVNVEAGKAPQLRAYYTALYHTMIAPNVYSDVDGRYRGRDKEVHQAKGYQMYTVFSLWDTYRACNPLYTLLQPARTRDFIQTFLRQYEQGGRLPIWELWGNETDCMIGNHAIPVMADAWLKGIRGYDGDLALQAMVHSADQDRLGLEQYRKAGYIHSDGESESVSKTLEYTFDDWCIALMAQSMGKGDTYQRFAQRAQQYKNLFDPASGFFRARTNGSWYTPFDPYEVNFNYTEANAWQYRFAAVQDISGMMNLLGGSDAFAAQLDALFTANENTTGRNQADITGLIGQYVQGNEPSHHMAYLYNFVGQPWKTQERVRQIMDDMYSDKPDGLSGNEDCGQMSAWLVWSGMGLYPAVPVGGQYQIGTPWFEEMSLNLDNGKTFTIIAPGVSSRYKYIAKATLNGILLNRSWITHEEILAGGELALEMSSKPTQWCTEVIARPVSAIRERPIVPVPFVARGKRVFDDHQEIKLGCLDNTAAIYYHTQVGTDNLDIPAAAEFKKYEGPFTIDTSTRLYCYAQRDNQRSLTESAVFSKMRSDLKILRYNTRYNNQYTGRGDNGLIDLLDGGADFRSGGWQGYEGVDVDVVIDLGSSKPIRSIDANFLQDENSWIFFPGSMRCEISEDGEHFTPIGEVASTVPTSEKGTLQQHFNLAPAGAQGRYVRVIGASLGVCPAGHKGAGNACWVFIDEIRIE